MASSSALELKAMELGQNGSSAEDNGAHRDKASPADAEGGRYHQLRKRSEASVKEQVLGALLYTVVSVAITFANKVVLTSYNMHSFALLSTAQSFSAVLLVPLACRLFRLPQPRLSVANLRALMPLPLIFSFNAFTSLGGTQLLSIPMMTVMRRFSILMTMLFEFFFLGVHATTQVSFTVFLMILGAVVAAADDLMYSAVGYAFVLVSDVFTALNGVYNKKKLEDCREVGMIGMTMLNNMFHLPLIATYCLLHGDFAEARHFKYWTNAGFLTWFVMASVLGVCLNFSMLYCTNVNSALTTSVVGCLKNVFVTYFGMVLVPGYAYTTWNFIGINVSVLGSLLYSYVKYQPQAKR